MMVDTQSKTFIHQVFVLSLVFGFFAINIGCSKKGLVAEKYSSEFYRVPKLLPNGAMDKNPKFIVCGDIQPGWRIEQKFHKRENWLTWKMLFFPFYEIYWLGNGLIGGVNFLRHTPDYGTKERRMVRDAIYAERSEIDFMFIVGDMVADGQRPSHWERFLQENKVELPLLLDVPFLPVIGNHDKANDKTYGLPNYEAIFDYPQFYVMDFPDAAIVVVDSNFIIDQYQFINDNEQDALFEEWFVSGEDSEQPAWLERELASRDQIFKIVIMHHPPISFGRHYSDWVGPSLGRNLKRKRQQLLNLFRKQGVQLVLCGHEHLYEHNILQCSQYEHAKNNARLSDKDPVGTGRLNATGGEIHFVVTGSGGAPTRAPSDERKLEKCLQSYRAEGFNVLLVKQEEIYNYCLMEITPDEVTIQVMEVTGDSTHPLRLVDEILIPKP